MGRTLSPQELRATLVNRKDVMLLDVRRKSDYDADNLKDIVVRFNLPSQTLQVYRNNGNLTFSAAPLRSPAESIFMIDMLDINNDGKGDLISLAWSFLDCTAVACFRVEIVVQHMVTRPRSRARQDSLFHAGSPE